MEIKMKKGRKTHTRARSRSHSPKQHTKEKDKNVKYHHWIEHIMSNTAYYISCTTDLNWIRKTKFIKKKTKIILEYVNVKRKGDRERDGGKREKQKSVAFHILLAYYYGCGNGHRWCWMSIIAVETEMCNHNIEEHSRDTYKPKCNTKLMKWKIFFAFYCSL